MNQGIFGFPTTLNGIVLSTKQIDVSGTYLIAPGTKRLVIFLVGAGGGGGGGGRRASGTAQSGGAAGSGGSLAYQDFLVEDLGGANTTLSIIIGAGGSIGGAASADNLSGTVGGAGGTTSITPTGKPGILMDCLGGLGGAGGSTTATTGGAARTGYLYGTSLTHIIGGGSSAVGVATNSIASTINSHGGAGGAGLATTPVALVGGVVYIPAIGSTPVVSNPDFARGSTIYSGGTSTVAPVNSYLHIMGKMSPGFGGAGGGSGTTGATKGGNGFRGSGGGGGGSTINTFTAGDGGKGGDGYVCIVALA